MKNIIKYLKIFILLLTVNAVAFANDIEFVVNTKQDLKTYITELTKDFDNSVLAGKKQKAKIKLVLRHDGEIILLDTGVKNKDLHNHIKKTVNRSYVKMGDIEPGNYTVDIKF